MELFYKKIIYNINFALNKIIICLSCADIDIAGLASRQSILGGGGGLDF